MKRKRRKQDDSLNTWEIFALSIGVLSIFLMMNDIPVVIFPVLMLQCWTLGQMERKK